MKKEDYEHDSEWRRWKGYVDETRMRITRIRKKRIWRKRMFKDWEDYGHEKRRIVKGSLTRDFRLQDTSEQFIFPRCRWYRSEKKTKSLKFIAGVNDTAEKLFTSVNNIADKFFPSVSDTADYRVLPILACLHQKMKK